MVQKSRIEWTESTWNPVTGCDKVSPGCEHCYADRMAKRLQAMGVEKYKDGFKVRIHEDVLDAPLSWQKPQIIFVNSMSDLCHKEVPLQFVKDIFEVMAQAEWHVFQILTKRSKRLIRLAEKLDWPENVMMGVTVESEHYKFRIDDLRKTAAKHKFLSLEPLIGPLGELNLSAIDWVIVGGESGPGSRPMDENWVLDIKKQCNTQKVPFFFKQWGGVNKKKTGRLLRGRTYDEVPRVLEIDRFKQAV